MPLKKIIIIANLNARGYDSGRVCDVRDLLDRSIDTKLVYSEYPNHAGELAALYGSDRGTLIAICGGDGSIHEAINGLPCDGMIGILPAGTANVVAKELGIPFCIKEAAKVLLTGALKRFDTGRIEKRRFLMVAGFGFDAHVAGSVPALAKKLLGQYAYHLESIRRYPFYSAPEIRVSVDGAPPAKGVFALIINLRRYGGDLFFSPKAVPDDGYLDLVLFKSLAPDFLLKGLWGAFTRRGVGPDVAHRAQGREFVLESDSPIPYQLDGEILPAKKAFYVSVGNKDLEMIVP